MALKSVDVTYRDIVWTIVAVAIAWAWQVERLHARYAVLVSGEFELLREAIDEHLGDAEGRLNRLKQQVDEVNRVLNVRAYTDNRVDMSIPEGDEGATEKE
jgi:hypothetical protein